jgi:hypothetical protein
VDLPDLTKKTNRALAEVFNRLTMNLGEKRPENKFTLLYNGKRFTGLQGFLDELESTGHTIRTRIVVETADFIGLAVEDNGEFRAVPIPAFVRTGLSDEQGKELLMAAPHGGLFVGIEGPDVNQELSFYQGVSGTFFRSLGIAEHASWMGERTVDTHAGRSARQAIRTSELWMEAVNGLATRKNMLMFGYGQTGVCVTATAVSQVAATGTTSLYPIVLDREPVIQWLRQLAQERPALAKDYEQLIQTVRALPDDAAPNAPRLKERLLLSNPYGDGPTPFPQMDHLRDSLSR